MAGNKLILLDALRRLSLGDGPITSGISVEDYVRSCLLIISSHSVDSCAAVERLGYECFTDESSGVPADERGISVREPGCFVTDVIEGLSRGTSVPEELANSVGEISLADYKAALFAVACILHVFQRSELDAAFDREYDLSTQIEHIVLSFRQLELYRETGEP